MASPKQIAIACEKACKRIDTWAKANVDNELTPLPRTHRKREMLRKQQLETIADWLERAASATDERLAMAQKLVKGGNWTKAQMEAILLGGNDASDSSTD